MSIDLCTSTGAQAEEWTGTGESVFFKEALAGEGLGMLKQFLLWTTPLHHGTKPSSSTTNHLSIGKMSQCDEKINT